MRKAAFPVPTFWRRVSGGRLDGAKSAGDRVFHVVPFCVRGQNRDLACSRHAGGYVRVDTRRRFVSPHASLHSVLHGGRRCWCLCTDGSAHRCRIGRRCHARPSARIVGCGVLPVPASPWLRWGWRGGAVALGAVATIAVGYWFEALRGSERRTSFLCCGRRLPASAIRLHGGLPFMPLCSVRRPVLR